MTFTRLPFAAALPDAALPLPFVADAAARVDTQHSSPVFGTTRAALRVRLLALGLLGISLTGGLAQAQVPGGYAEAPANVTLTYHGSDDSVLSLRQIGNQVVGFSQHPLGQQAYVFTGQTSGQQIVGQYVTLPRGGSTSTGAMTLAWSQGGSQLSRVSGGFGEQTWIAKLPTQFVFPKGGEARFQTTSAGDMDGAYQGKDGGRIWVRQTGGGAVFWYAERFASPADTRPVYASVGVGTRGAQGQLSGQFWDLPHQTGPLLSGTTVGAVSGGSRDFAINMQPWPAGPSPRGVSYKADYAVDLDRFEQEIRDRVAPFAVGFSYAIAQDGNVLRQGAGGSRWVPISDPGQEPGTGLVTGINPAYTLPFTTGTLGEMASTSKTVTAVAVLKALRGKGVSVDAPVAPYLPTSWVRGPGMDTVTFRQLLSHGIKPTVGNRLGRGAANCKVDFYGCLRDAVATGMTQPAGYDNIHYTLMRYILPIVYDPVTVQVWIAAQDDQTTINQVLSADFRDRIRALLASVGVDADFQYVVGPGEHAAFRYPWANPLTSEIAPVGSEDDYLAAGSGGLKMKPSEFAKFLSRLERGDILGAADMAILRDISYGETSSMQGPNGVGPLWRKNGGASGTASQLVVYPGTEVFYNQNSTGHPNQPSLAATLRDAWAASLVGAP